MILRVILDTNIIISALLKPKGKQATILRMAKKGLFQIQMSSPIFEEIKRVFGYPKIWKKIFSPKERLDQTIAALVRVSEWIEPEEKFHIIKNDTSDNKYLECAAEGGADYIVSGDEDLLSLGNFQHTKIVSTRTFLEIINKLIK